MSGQRRALIVATGEYDHAGLRHLRAPAADAARLAEVLGDPQIGDFEVQVVRNQAAHEVQAQVEDLFATGSPDDVLLVHFSCHGLKSESGELFFAARNTRPERLGSTAIPADFVQRCLRSSRSRSIVLLLDCCYGGAFGQGVTVRASGDVNVLDSFPGGTLGGGRGRAVITASSAMEYAFEGDRLADDHTEQPSVFTSALVDGLATGEADRDEDGWVSLNELYDYVFDRVRSRTPHQTPSRDIEMSGELYLARSRRRRIRPAPVPPDLQAAMTDPNMFTRLGAVSELRSRLASDDLPVAAGAYDALADIARTDIQYVADAAAAGMQDVALGVEEPELYFGQVRQGSDPLHRTLHLLGPPLSRTCTFQASHTWLTVEETPGGFDVSVDTSVVGRRQGSVTITGPTGEVTIPVDVEITPGATEQPPPSSKPAASPESTSADTAVQTLAGKPAAGPPADPSKSSARDPHAPPARVDRPPKGASILAIAAAVLLLIGIVPDYHPRAESLINGTGELEWIVVVVITLAVMALVAGVLTLVPRTRRPLSAGLLLGVAAASTWWFVFLVTDWLWNNRPGWFLAGFWIELVATLALIVAGFLVGLAVARARDVRLLHQIPNGALAWTVGLLGFVGAISLALLVGDLQAVLSIDLRWFLAPAVWATILALVIPACAATAVPRRFGASLLAGWISGGATLFFFYHVFNEQARVDASTPINVFGLTLLGLLIAAVLLARTVPGSTPRD